MPHPPALRILWPSPLPGVSVPGEEATWLIPSGAADHPERGCYHNDGISMKLGKRLLVGIGIVSPTSIALADALAGYLVYSHAHLPVLLAPTGAYLIG